ncbi:MAG: chemotaxis protein CheW [Polyangia bacterium]
MTVLHVAFKVGGGEYVLPASDVLHLESFEGATRVPGTSEFVAGLVHSRGQVVPVVDLRLRFGLPAAERSLDARLLIVQVGSRTAGLLVDSAREVLDLDESAFREPPELIDEQALGLIKAVAQAGERMVMLINLPKLIGVKAHAE